MFCGQTWYSILASYTQPPPPVSPASDGEERHSEGATEDNPMHSIHPEPTPPIDDVYDRTLQSFISTARASRRYVSRYDDMASHGVSSHRRTSVLHSIVVLHSNVVLQTTCTRVLDGRLDGRSIMNYILFLSYSAANLPLSPSLSLSLPLSFVTRLLSCYHATHDACLNQAPVYVSGDIYSKLEMTVKCK